MTRSIAPRARGLLALGATLELAAVIVGRPQLAVVAVPLLAFLVIALAGGEAPDVGAELEVARERMLEGETCSATLTVRNSGRRAVEVELELAHAGGATVTPPGRLLAWLAPGAARTIALDVSAPRWGLLELGPVRVRVRGGLMPVQWHGQLGARAVVRVFPTEQRLRELIAPVRTQPVLGSHVARMRGDGIEFAEVRPFVAGDRARRINWRVTARRGALHVNDRHPEHTGDVVLLLDTFAEARTGCAGTLDDAVRATATLVRALVAQRDRVALADIGGGLRWVEAGTGPRQLYRIVDVLLTSAIVSSHAGRSVQSFPRRVLGPGALVVAVTPLLDERSVNVLVNLRRRGIDAAVLEVSPLAHVGDHELAVVDRLWRLRREVLRARLRGLGLSTSEWSDDRPLALAIEEVNRFRRSLLRAARH